MRAFLRSPHLIKISKKIDVGKNIKQQSEEKRELEKQLKEAEAAVSQG